MADQDVAAAEDAERVAKLEGRPTPAWASRLLIAADAAELKRLQGVERRMWERVLRANTVDRAHVRGLPYAHPDRLSLSEIAPLVDLHRTVVNYHRRRWAAEHPELIPTYQDAAAAPAGP